MKTFEQEVRHSLFVSGLILFASLSLSSAFAFSAECSPGRISRSLSSPPTSLLQACLSEFGWRQEAVENPCRLVLYDTMPQKGPSSSSRNGFSTTARESAVLVEWEPVSELERRIDEGVHYEHWPEFGSDGARERRNEAATARATRMNKSQKDATQTVRGVFCGYKGTSEERSRLKSADPDDVVDYSI